MPYGNSQQSIEQSATAKKRLEIANKDLRSDKLATVEPWKSVLPEGVEQVRLDNSILTERLKAASLILFTIDELQVERFQEYLEEHDLTMGYNEEDKEDASIHYFNAAGTEVRLPRYVKQRFVGLENYIAMCVAQLAAPAAQKASAAMLGAETRTEQIGFTKDGEDRHDKRMV